MKKVLLFAIVLVSFESCMSIKQTAITIPGIEKIIGTDLTKDKGYLKANEWAVTTFVNAESVIQFSDKEEGVVMGKYALKPASTSSTYNVMTGQSSPYTIKAVFALIRVQSKDKAIKISITPNDFTVVTVNDGVGGKTVSYSREQALIDVETLITGFENYIKGASKSDW